MTYIKMDTYFVSLDKLAELSELPSAQIEHCVDHGLLDNEEATSKYFPEKILTVRKLRLALKILRANLSEEKQRVILERADIFDASIATDESVKLMLSEVK